VEYWRSKYIFFIARGVETSFSLDDFTINKSRGFFARVLVDHDMFVELPKQLLVERPRFAFVDEVEYEKLPTFCSSCKMIGHSFSNCRKLNFEKPHSIGQ